MLPPSHAALPQAPDLSIILAEAGDNIAIDPALHAIERACAGLLIEVLIVRPVGGRPPLPDSSLPVHELVCPSDSLVPERWGVGVRAAQAPYFACLTTELAVAPDWATTLQSALSGGAPGAAGCIALGAIRGTAAAIYLARFNAFLPSAQPHDRVTHQIPGDGAIYRRSAVTQHQDLLVQGFWEAEFHRRFEAAGPRPRFVDRALVTFDTSTGVRAAMRLRYLHAFGYGVTRVTEHHERMIHVLLAAPLVPLSLLARCLRRAVRAPKGFRTAAVGLPALVLLCVAWAWGEAAGAWASRGSAA